MTSMPGYASLLSGKRCTLISPTNDVKLISTGSAATKAAFADLW